MNYFEHNDSKGRDARVRAAINRADRAKSQDFDGTMFMSKWDVIGRRVEGQLSKLVAESVERCAPTGREPRNEHAANRAMVQS